MNHASVTPPTMLFTRCTCAMPTFRLPSITGAWHEPPAGLDLHSQPFAHCWSMSKKFAAQPVTPHSPLVHAAAMTLPMQVLAQFFPHVPQFIESLPRSISQPSFSLSMSQSSKPTSHLPLHTPVRPH